MLPGPHPADTIAYGAFVSVHHGRQVLATRASVGEGRLEVNGGDAVPEALSFTVPVESLPSDARGVFAPYGQEVTPSWVLVDSSGVETVIRRAPMLLTGWEPSGKVTAKGLLERIVEDSWALPSSPAPGARLRDEAQRIAGSHLPVIVDGANPLLPATLAWGGDKMKNLQDLCAAYGVRPVVKPDGYLHLQNANTQANQIAARYSTDRDVIEVSGGEARERYNTFIVWAKTSTGENAATVVAKAQINNGPLNTSTYGERTLSKELEAGSTYHQCRDEVKRMMRSEMLSLGTVQVQILPDPRIELGDVISVSTPQGVKVGRVNKFSLPFKHDELMRIDLQEVAF